MLVVMGCGAIERSRMFKVGTPKHLLPKIWQENNMFRKVTPKAGPEREGEDWVRPGYQSEGCSARWPTFSMIWMLPSAPQLIGLPSKSLHSLMKEGPAGTLQSFCHFGPCATLGLLPSFLAPLCQCRAKKATWHLGQLHALFDKHRQAVISSIGCHTWALAQRLLQTLLELAFGKKTERQCGPKESRREETRRY